MRPSALVFQAVKTVVHPVRQLRSTSAGLSTNTIAATSSTTGTLDPEEIAKFNGLADQFTDEQGTFKPLHSLNCLRVPWIINGLGKTPKFNALEGLRILDVGCGGGILSLPLARLGANVVGIDGSTTSIDLCNYMAFKLSSSKKLSTKFINTSIEDFALTSEGTGFDAVVASEVIEHVANPESFLRTCVKAVKPGGKIFITTINKTLPGQFFAIFLAEDVFRVVPQGVHDYEKFISPKELKEICEESRCHLGTPTGMVYNAVCNAWSWTPYAGINYAIMATRLS